MMAMLISPPRRRLPWPSRCEAPCRDLAAHLLGRALRWRAVAHKGEGAVAAAMLEAQLLLARAPEVAARHFRLAELEPLGQTDDGTVRFAGDRIADRLEHQLEVAGNAEAADARSDIDERRPQGPGTVLDVSRYARKTWRKAARLRSGHTTENVVRAHPQLLLCRGRSP